mmetsp:Transcript_8844/g.14720  ORF Transcript_8844/g.14720 Transcript_8844/m.14720 type:complete len:88 (+) Transcript_8844:1829-2092(+)
MRYELDNVKQNLDKKNDNSKSIRNSNNDGKSDRNTTTSTTADAAAGTPTAMSATGNGNHRAKQQTIRRPSRVAYSRRDFDWNSESDD